MRPTTILGLLVLLLRRRAGLRAALALACVSLALAGVSTVAPTRRAAGVHAAWNPSLVYDGRGYGVIWSEAESERPYARRHLYFTRVDEDGRRLGARTKLSVLDRSLGEPQLVWTGREYGVLSLAWNNSERDPRYEIHFTRLSAEGAVVSEPRLVSLARVFSRDPQLAFARGSYRLAWTQTIESPGVVLARASETGAWVESPHLVYADEVSSLSLGTQGDHDVIAARERGGVDEPSAVRVVWAQGTHREEVRLVTGRDPYTHVVLAPSAHSVELAWIYHDVVASEMVLRFASVNRYGPRVTPRDLLRRGFASALTTVPIAGGHLLAWSDIIHRESMAHALVVSDLGEVQRGPWRVDDSRAFAATLRLAQSDGGYGVVWVDGRDGGARVYFARLDAKGERVGAAVPVSD
jgi:hypothetical protein